MVKGYRTLGKVKIAGKEYKIFFNKLSEEIEIFRENENCVTIRTAFPHTENLKHDVVVVFSGLETPVKVKYGKHVLLESIYGELE